MTAIEVVVEIAKYWRPAEYLFNIYTPSINLKEEGFKGSSIERMLRHNSEGELIVLEDKEVTAVRLTNIISSLKGRRVLALLSRTPGKNDGLHWQPHLPLMDFDCPESPENLEKVKLLLRKILPPRDYLGRGAILFSGRSYQFYGSSGLSMHDWLKFMGECGLSGLADSRHIFHRLVDGNGCLRLSTCSLRPKVPTVVAVL